MRKFKALNSIYFPKVELNREIKRISSLDRDNYIKLLHSNITEVNYQEEDFEREQSLINNYCSKKRIKELLEKYKITRSEAQKIQDIDADIETEDIKLKPKNNKLKSEDINKKLPDFFIALGITHIAIRWHVEGLFWGKGLLFYNNKDFLEFIIFLDQISSRKKYLKFHYGSRFDFVLNKTHWANTKLLKDMGIFGMNYNTICFRDSYNTHKNPLETYSPVNMAKKINQEKKKFLNSEEFKNGELDKLISKKDFSIYPLNDIFTATWIRMKEGPGRFHIGSNPMLAVAMVREKYFPENQKKFNEVLEEWFQEEEKSHRFCNNQIKDCYVLYIKNIYLEKKKKMHAGYWWRKIYGTITKKIKTDPYYNTLKHKLFAVIPFYEKYKDLNSLDYSNSEKTQAFREYLDEVQPFIQKTLRGGICLQSPRPFIKVPKGYTIKKFDLSGAYTLPFIDTVLDERKWYLPGGIPRRLKLWNRKQTELVPKNIITPDIKRTLWHPELKELKEARYIAYYKVKIDWLKIKEKYSDETKYPPIFQLPSADNKYREHLLEGKNITVNTTGEELKFLMKKYDMEGEILECKYAYADHDIILEKIFLDFRKEKKIAKAKYLSAKKLRKVNEKLEKKFLDEMINYLEFKAIIHSSIFGKFAQRVSRKVTNYPPLTTAQANMLSNKGYKTYVCQRCNHCIFHRESNKKFVFIESKDRLAKNITSLKKQYPDYNWTFGREIEPKQQMRVTEKMRKSSMWKHIKLFTYSDRTKHLVVNLKSLFNPDINNIVNILKVKRTLFDIIIPSKWRMDTYWRHLFSEKWNFWKNYIKVNKKNWNYFFSWSKNQVSESFKNNLYSLYEKYLNPITGGIVYVGEKENDNLVRVKGFNYAPLPSSLTSYIRTYLMEKIYQLIDLGCIFLKCDTDSIIILVPKGLKLPAEFSNLEIWTDESEDISIDVKTIFTPRDKVFITDLKKIHCCKGIQKKNHTEIINKISNEALLKQVIGGKVKNIVQEEIWTRKPEWQTIVKEIREKKFDFPRFGGPPSNPEKYYWFTDDYNDLTKIIRLPRNSVEKYRKKYKYILGENDWEQNF